MSVVKISTSSPFSAFAIFVFFVMLTGTSCANKKKLFLTSTVVPAAEGTVKIKTDKNKNHTIEINLVNLAGPERLSPPKTMYMVWMETDQGVTKNIGQIVTNDGTFSKTYKSSFKTVSSYTPAKIFITAENDPNVSIPSWEVILTTARF